MLPAGRSVLLDLQFTVPPDPGGSGRIENCASLGGPSALPGDRGTVMAVQQELNRLGYEAGPVDGATGRRTRAAIQRYQQVTGQPTTGEIDEALLASLFGGELAPMFDPNAANDRACTTVRIERPPVVAPPPPPSAPVVIAPAPQVVPPPPQVTPPPPPPALLLPPPPPPQVVCTGGKVVVGNQCVCPSGTIEMRGLCVPSQAEPPVIAPQLIPAPFLIICPEGQVWSEANNMCLPVVQ